METKVRKESLGRNFHTKNQYHIKEEHKAYEWEAKFEDMRDMIQHATIKYTTL